MASFRIQKIAELTRQLAFTPQEVRLAQISAAENLLLELDPNRAYPSEFIVFRITGYRSKKAEAVQLAGLALQHDLGLMIENVSQGLNLRVDQSAQAVLTIEEVTRRFNVTNKTIQRWRRRGLSARRFIFPDGKRRVGFLLPTVERFLAKHRDRVVNEANFSQIGPEEEARIVRLADRLAKSGLWIQEIDRRIAGRLNRAVMAIEHVLNAHPCSFSLAASPSEEIRSQIARGHRRGRKIPQLSREYGYCASGIYRIVIEDRLARVLGRKVKFIDDPLYHQDVAASAIEAVTAQTELAPPAEAVRIPCDLPPYLQDLYRTPLLTPARERALFLELNFHKYRFVTARRKIEPDQARWRDVRKLETLRRRVVDAKNQIVQANLRLVVSVARKHMRSGLSLMDLISDGNLTLIRAIDSFDIHRGHRFSTYSTLALMKGFARGVPAMRSAARRASGGQALLPSVADHSSAGDFREVMHRDHVSRLMQNLSGREREVIQRHFGLRSDSPATYEQVGKTMGLSKQRVRQIEQMAIEKMRVGGELG